MRGLEANIPHFQKDHLLLRSPGVCVSCGILTQHGMRKYYVTGSTNTTVQSDLSSSNTALISHVARLVQFKHSFSITRSKTCRSCHQAQNTSSKFILQSGNLSSQSTDFLLFYYHISI